MITSKDIFHIVLNDKERHQLYMELRRLIPMKRESFLEEYPKACELLRALREESD